MFYQPTPTPPAPPVNDALYQALSPAETLSQEKQRLKAILDKYGVKQAPKPQGQPRQWVGDNNG